MEDDGDAGRELVSRIYTQTGRAFLVGVTGAPGRQEHAGRSSDRGDSTGGLKVGVIAVDPTSPFSGGAVLGDRVRMNAHAADAGVFIRSMATRGHLGGLARATSDAALVLDAAGSDVVIIETVGVGQDEVDIVSAADISIVLLLPGAGDDLQAIKAGVMEIGDIFVVNKADREGADRVVQAVASNLSLKTYDASNGSRQFSRPATTGAGVDVLWKESGRFREWGRRASAVAPAATARVEASRSPGAIVPAPRRRSAAPEEFDRYVEAVASRARDPYSVVEEIMNRIPSPDPGSRDESGPRSHWHRRRGYRQGVGLLQGRARPGGRSAGGSPDRTCESAQRPVGGPVLEPEATAPDSAIATYISKRGPGIHHVTLRVENLRATLAQSKDRGVRLVDLSRVRVPVVRSSRLSTRLRLKASSSN